MDVIPDELLIQNWKANPLIAQAGELVAKRLEEAATGSDADALYAVGQWRQWAPNAGRQGDCFRWYWRAALAGSESGRRRILHELLAANYLEDETPEQILAQAMEQAGIASIPVLDPFSQEAEPIIERLIKAHAQRRESGRVRLKDGMPPIEFLRGRRWSDEEHKQAVWHNSRVLNESLMSEREEERKRLAAAEAGDLNAAFEQGEILLTGWLLPRDEEGAFKWLRCAAEGEHTGAQLVLGAMYQYGIGTPRNYASAIEWYQRAHDRGSPWGLVGLGILHEEGRGVAKNFSMALSHYQDAVSQLEQGNDADGYLENLYARIGRVYETIAREATDLNEAEQAYACALQWYGRGGNRSYVSFKIGTMYAESLGTGKDPIKAIQLYFDGARLYDYGYPDRRERESDYRVGRLYQRGDGLPQDLEGALLLFEVADTVDSLFEAALLAEQESVLKVPPEKILAWYRRGARKLVEETTRHLHLIDILPFNERRLGFLSQALESIRRGAANGQAQLQFELAWLTHNSFVAPLTADAAEDVLRHAAASGHAPAIAYLAIRGEEGCSEPSEQIDILKLFRETAKIRLGKTALGPPLTLTRSFKSPLPDFSGMSDEQIDAMNALRRAESDLGMTKQLLENWLWGLGRYAFLNEA